MTGLVPLFREKCKTCVFRPGNPMRLKEGRLADLVESNRERGTALYCHLTIHGLSPETGKVLCRGYYDAYGEETASIQVLHRMCADAGEEPFEEIDPW